MITPITTSTASTAQTINPFQLFNNPEFGDLRCIEKDGEPWFVGKDVATALGYADTAKAIRAHVDAEDKQIIKVDEMATLDVKSNFGMTIINESGLYSLIFGSKLEKAKRFKHWVTSEVLPCIRKTGGSQRIIFTLYFFIICSILMISSIEGGNTSEKEVQKFSYHFSGYYYDLFSSALSIGSHQEERNKNIQ